MPKKLFQITNFEGGISNVPAGMDLEDNELMEAQNVNLSATGKIMTMGDGKQTPRSAAPPSEEVTCSFDPGYGLYSFSSDRDQDGDQTECDWYAYQNANEIMAWDNSTEESGTLFAWGGAGSRPEFLFHKGVLRIVDSNFENTDNAREWYGYVDHSALHGEAEPQMESADADLVTPTKGGWDDGWVDEGEGFNIYGVALGTGGSLEDITLKFACSYIYDDFQETPLYEMDGEINGFGENGEGSLEGIKIRVDAPFSDVSRRIRGGRIYCKDTNDQTRDWYLMYDLDFTHGWRSSLGNDYDNDPGWVLHNEEYAQYYIEPDDFTVMSPETFETINGYNATDAIDCKYKTAVMVEGITYAGNVYQNGVHYPDRMIKNATTTQGIALDVFPSSNYIDVATGDGDAIVKLATYGGMVLQFKRNKLYVVAYSADLGDYLEAEYPQRGVTHPGHVVTTPHGVVFMNEAGVFKYNTEGITELTAKISGQSTTSGQNIILNTTTPAGGIT